MKAKSLCLPALAALLATQARAVDVTSTWDGNGGVVVNPGNTNWSTAVNWNPDGTPPFGNNQALIFNGTFKTTHAIGLDRTVKSISFDANADSAFIVRLRNGTADTEVGRVLTFQSDTGVSTLSMDADAAAAHQLVSGTLTGAGTAGRIVLANQLNVVQNSTSLLTLADTATIISGGTGATINKSGAGILVLGGTNTFTDAVNINAGTLRIGSGGALGTNAGGTFVADGATLDVAAVKITTTGENVSVIGNGVGGVGAFYSSTGNLGTSNIGVNLILTGNASVGVGGARNGLTSGTITSGGMNYTLTKVGTGQFDTEGSSVSVGDIVVNQGIFQTATTATFNTGYPIIVNSGAEFRMFELVPPLARNFQLNGGTINNTGAVNVTGDTISGNITLTGSGSINSGGGVGDFLTISGNVGESAAGATLNIGGNRTVALPGTNTYTGDTTVTTGALRAAGTFTSNISVAGGATLDGEGSTTGSLNLNAGANVIFNATTTGANQYFRANGVTTGGSIAVTPSTLVSGSNIVVLQTATGTLSLADYYLPFGTLGDLSLGAGDTQLLYTNAGANLEWRAFDDNVWTEFGSANFQNLTTNNPAPFVSGDNVDFVNIGTGTVSQVGGIVAGVVNFKNTAGNDFSIQPSFGETLTAISINHTSTGDVTIGSGIVGTTPISKSGTGKLVLAGVNTSTGAITNSTGILQLGDNVATNSTLAAATLANSGTFDIRIAGAGITTATIPAAISGSGTVVHSGTNITVLSGANTYTGTTTVSSGTLRFRKPASLYNGTPAAWTPANITVGSGATLAFETDAPGFSTADISTLIANLVNGPVAGYKAGSVLGLNPNVDTTIADNIPDSTGTGGGAIGFFKGGAAVLTLTGTNTFSGGLAVNNGTLVAGDAQLGTGTISMGVAGGNINTLSLTGGTDNPILFSSGGTANKIFNLASGVTDATLSGTITLDSIVTGPAPSYSRLVPTGGTIVVSGKMTGAGGIGKRSTGTVVITNPTNDYTGPTNIVDAGTLLVDGRITSANVYFGENVDGSGTGSANGTLGGKGLVTGNVTTKAGSFISPGGTSAAGVNTDTVDTLTIGGTLDVSVSATGTGKLVYQLAAPAFSDKLAVGGLTVGPDVFGFSDFTFTTGGGFAPGVYTLISSSTAISGTLNPADLTGMVGGISGTLSISGNNLILTAANPSTPFQSWMATYYPSITSPNNDPAVDFDGDGTSNFGEFAFAGAPDSGTSAGPRRSAIDNISGTDYITLTIATRSGTGFSGSAPATASKDGVNYTVAGSLDLTTFTEPVTEVIPAITTGLPALGSGPLANYEYHTFLIAAPRSANPKAFLRAIAAP